MKLAATALALALSAISADSPPPSYVLNRVSTTDIPAVASSLIALPIACGPSAQLFFTMYRREDPLGVPILEVEKDGTSVANTFYVGKIQDSDIPHPEKLRLQHFQVQGSTLFVAAAVPQSGYYILKFSTDDASYQGAITMEKGFWPMRFAVFDSGSIVASGLSTRVDPATNKSRSENVIAEYGADGRLVQYLHLAGDVVLAGTSPSPKEMERISFTHMASSGSSIYLIRPGDPLLLSVIVDGAASIEQHVLWSPGADWRVSAFLAFGDRAILGFVDKDGQNEEYVQYSLSSFEPTSLAVPAKDAGGAFGCTDWQGNFYSLTTTNKHLAVLRAR